jgi:hypothetical protein
LIRCLFDFGTHKIFSQSLNLLSNNPLNIKKLRTATLLSLLSELSEHDDANINQTASIILDNLTDCVNGDEDESAAPVSAAPVAPSVASSAASASASSSASASISAAGATRKSTYLNTITLAVPALAHSASLGVAVDRLLVTQPGVVSASVDHMHNRVTVYSSTYTKDSCTPLLTVLESAGFPSTVLNYDAAAAAAGGAAGASKENAGAGYLNAAQFAQGGSGSNKGLAMAVYREANQDASLAARTARKQVEQKQQEQKQQGLVSRLSSWFW